MIYTTVQRNEMVVLGVSERHPDEPYLDWESTTICIPAMGYLISDGVLFIRGIENTWIWMCCENVEQIVGDEQPRLRDQLNALWETATSNRWNELLPGLNRRQSQVARMRASGLSHDQIATATGLTYHSVATMLWEAGKVFKCGTKRLPERLKELGLVS